MRQIAALFIAAPALTLTLAVTALAGPGAGSVVIIDQPSKPDLIIQNARSQNSGATHIPVTVRVSTPESGGKQLKSAEIKAYVTSMPTVDAPPMSETEVKIGPQWTNRSILLEIPSPHTTDEYFIHVRGDLHFDDNTSMSITSSLESPVKSGAPEQCGEPEEVQFQGPGEQRLCPILFGTKLYTINGAKNERLISLAAREISKHCKDDTLNVVTVYGWASTLPSRDQDLPNEELARKRALAVVAGLQGKVPESCWARIENKSVEGNKGVTEQFGGQEDNQCAQIIIKRHVCTAVGEQ